jgi:hypothetical protein
MSEFMKRGSVISGGIFESLLGREIDAVAGAIVERLVSLIVMNLGAGIIENLLRHIHDFE